MFADLLGESMLLCLGFSRAPEGTYTFETLVARPDRQAWTIGPAEKPTATLQFPLQATDLVAFCHQCLLEEDEEPHVLSVQRLLPKAILLRQTLRLAQKELTSA